MRPFSAILLIFALVIPSFSFAADQAGADQAALVGYSPRASQSEREWEVEVSGDPRSGESAGIHAAACRRGRITWALPTTRTTRNGFWRTSRSGDWTRTSRRSTCCFRRRKCAWSKWSRRRRFTAKLDEPALAVDPTSNQKAEQLPTYNAYSIDGDVTAPLVFRELRAAGGLRKAGPAGDFGERRDRDREVLALVARGQTEGGGGAWRDRLPDLFRAEGRRLRGRQRFPAGPDAQSRRSAARQRDGFCVVESGRSADAGRGRDAGCEAAGRSRKRRASPKFR